MRTRLFSILFLLLTAVMGTWAQNVTPEQAKQIAAQFLQGKRTDKSSKRAPGQNELKTAVVFNAKDMAGQPYLYAVSATLQDGFVLVSGDERFKAVLGYSDVSNFDEHNMPDNMRAFLQDYIDEMQYLKGIDYQPSTTAGARRAAAAKSDISPLVTTTWNQGAPYNNQCPTDPSTNQTSVTGCVATAMAQVVAYHIKKGDGPTSLIADIPAYTTATHSISVPAITDRNLPNSSLLLNSYANGAGSLDEKAAVAKLMFYCGASVYMDYASSSSGSNGAYAPNALINYFGFDSTTRLVSRSKYTYAEWIDLMYDELAAQRPVFYGGQSAGGGHAFVLDGFRASDSFFHVNWGWGGSNDGYFALSVLNPYDTSQIGASSTNDGFAMYQDAVIGVQIGSGQTYTEPIYLDMTGFSVDGQDVKFNAFSVINDNSTHKFDIGVELINENGDIIGTNTLFTTGDLGYLVGYNNVTYPVGNNQAYANQTIKIVPVSREYGTTTWYPSTNPNIDYFTATYDANGVPTLAVRPTYSLSGTISVPSNKYVSYTQDVNVSITNNGDEFYGPIYLFASTDANNKGAAVTRLGVTSLTNTTETSTFEWTPTATGNYTLWVTRDEQGNEVIATGSVTITEDLGILIANKTDWDNFCAAVNNGNNYYGKTVRLTSDIGTAQDPVTTMAGTIENSSVRLFMGTFIGGGHTLTVGYNTTAEVTAPFRYVYNAVIQDLHVAGTITTNQEFASGLVGDIFGGTSVTIQNCRSSVTINSAKSGYGTHGGFIGKLNTNATANITGSLFDGSFTTTNATQHCGGFIGYTFSSAENIHISNSVMKPSSVTSGMLENTFVRYASGTPDITNCYYIPVTNIPTNQGKEAHTISGNNDITSLAISGTATEYNASGITAYEGSNGLKYGSTVYAGNGDVVGLALTANPPAHYSVDAYTASAGSITKNSATSATLTMPNEDVTVGATWQPDELDTDDSGAYVINTKDDWNRFCLRVNNGLSTYSGKTVKLTGNIGTAQNPVTTMAGTDTNRFRGTFDGGGYTLTIGYGTSENRFNEQYAAPFRHVIYATIQNLTVAGNIYTDQQYAAGFVGKAITAVLIKNCYSNVNITTSSNFAAGFVAYAIYSLTIENCRSSATIISSLSGDGTHGGFVGDIDNKDENITITGCLFDGSITTTNSTQHCGGFIGFTHKPSRTTISNSVMASSNVSSGMLDNTFARYSGETAPTITNCYYIPVTNMPTNQGKEAHTISGNNDITNLAISGTATEYNASGITAYEGSNGLKYGSTVYAGNGDVVGLALTANPPAHYSVDAYTASAGSITTNSATSATLTMPNEDVTVGATWQPDELDTDDSGAYVINTKDDWNRFCARVASGANNYNGATVKLTADIGTTQDPVTTMAGTDTNRFRGTFDGGGYTLTIGYGTSENRFNEQYAAPFRFVKGATIQNLHVAGDIYIHQQCAAGIVGQVKESPVTLTNCRSSVNINSDIDYSGQHAGFVAYIWPVLNGNSITGCLFDGSLTTTSTTTSCGTFFAVAGGTTTVTNCVVMPSNVSAGMLSNTFGYGSDITFTNCYYVPVENLPTTQGTAAHAISAGTNVTSLAISTTPTTTYNVSGITLYGDNKGIMVGSSVYAAQNDVVDLTLAAPSQPGATVGFVASAGTLDQTDATHATLTMPNEDVTISADYLVNTNYIAADGTSQSHAAKELTSSDEALASGWYVVSEDVAFSNRIVVSGTVNLILADGKTLTASAGVNVPENSSLIIWGQSSGTGKLTAQPGVSNQAAIGGGNEGGEGVNNSAGTITIYGGKVTATSWAGAGIGGGGTYVEGGVFHGSSGGTVNIYGGTVTAQGGMGAAIGGSSGCTGFTVNIYGGTINATSGAMAAAIGGGDQSTGGTVNIHGGNITANAIDYGSETPTDGFGIGSGTFYKSLATVNLSWTNATDHITATSYNGTVNLKKAFQDTDGATWSAADNISTKPDGKTLYPANTLLFLADNADNSADISAANGNTRNVVLSGRTLIKDGNWNTLCLPFNVTIASSPLAGDNVIAKVFDDTSNLDGEGQLTLNFTTAPATIPAGTPFIIKWDNTGVNLENPVFAGVTISNAAAQEVKSTDTKVKFVGQYSPFNITAENINSILYVASGNKIGYSKNQRTLKSCRAHFWVQPNGPAQAAARFINIDWGDGETTSISIVNFDSENAASGIYTLDGRKLSTEPTQKGLYIMNGKKVIIK